MMWHRKMENMGVPGSAVVGITEVGKRQAAVASWVGRFFQGTTLKKTLAMTTSVVPRTKVGPGDVPQKYDEKRLFTVIITHQVFFFLQGGESEESWIYRL
jgi:hypothetical protein